jgi:hypothetical protein
MALRGRKGSHAVIYAASLEQLIAQPERAMCFEFNSTFETSFSLHAALARPV